jgi:hypothetical protein
MDDHAFERGVIACSIEILSVRRVRGDRSEQLSGCVTQP